MRKKKGSSVQSVRAIALIVALVLSLPWQAAAAENVLILNSDFVQKYKNRATIEVNYVIDKAHKKPNPPSKDADYTLRGGPPRSGSQPSPR